MSSVTDYCICNQTLRHTIDLPDDFARKIFRECLYTETDVISFVIGLSSLAFWIVAQAPQFYLNCKLGRAKGLSLCFLIEWLTGDSLNLAGAFLTGQVGTAVFTALLFVSMDITLATQYILLERPCCRNYDDDSEEEDDSDDSDNEPMHHRDRLDNPLLDPTQEEEQQQQRNVSKSNLYSIFLPVVLFSAVTVSGFGIVSITNAIGGSERSLLRVATRHRSLQGRSLLESVVAAGPLPPQLSKDCDATPPVSHIGVVLSWASAAIYLLSRIPQIWKNYRRQSVQGLSPILFACAVLGNTTYALGIIIKGQRLIGALPFLIGSIGTLCFDATILIQFFIYRGMKPKKRSRHHGRKPSRNQLEGVHGVTHWANSPFQSPTKRDDPRGATVEGERKLSGLRNSYGGNDDNHTRNQSSA